MAELLHNPAKMAKAKQELAEKFGSGVVTIGEQEAMQLPYLNAVIKETMRLHVIAPLLLPHRAEKEVEICGFTIPKHTLVLVNAWAISRDTAYWENPTKFEPERFLSTDFDFRGNQLSFIPFSAGRRICPGISLGVRMLNLLLANLLHNFDWKLPNGMEAQDMDMKDNSGITLQKADPLVAIAVKATV